MTALLLVWLGVAAAQDHPAEVACAHCHEDVHEGQAEEGCATCHTPEAWSPTTFSVEQHAQTAFALGGRHEVTACGDCHTSGRLKGLPLECAGCHVDRHRGKLGDVCADCHTDAGFTPVEGFEHADRTGFALAGVHEAPECAACHQGDNGRALRLVADAACTTCHGAGHGDIGSDCKSCHALDGGSFARAHGAAVFDHRGTGFALERRHKAHACGSCHTIEGPRPVPRCASCHVDPHSGQLGQQCADCHRPDRWRLARFDHDQTGWALRGRHFVAGCAECHSSQRWMGLSTECWDCHAQDAARAPASVPAHGFGRGTCQDCHGVWSFRL